MSELYLCGMTGDRLKDITELTECFDYFDGLVWVDHMSQDGTYELLESRKKNGKIIRRPYVKQHSHSQNEVLFSRHIKNASWIFWADSPERITKKWLSTMRDDIKKYEQNGTGGVYFSGRPYLWQYYDNQQFQGSPHWGITHIYGKMITFGESVKNQYIINKRDLNPENSYCLHPIKYWYCFNPSNETECMYSKYGPETVAHHERLRQVFRLYCEGKLGLSLDSLDDLIGYFTKIKNKEIVPEKFFTDVVEMEFRLTELFQLKVLGMDFMNEIVPNRYKFSFKNYLETGNGFSDPNYKGTTLLYDDKLSNVILQPSIIR